MRGADVARLVALAVIWSLSFGMLALALICSGVAYLLYYRLIADVGPTRAMTVTFLMPAFGIAWGALFLDERVTLAMVAGAAMIITGTAAVLRVAPARRGVAPL
ncbi:MAG: EamA family transporter [Casimicrobiaceae bacterium]